MKTEMNPRMGVLLVALTVVLLVLLAVRFVWMTPARNPSARRGIAERTSPEPVEPARAMIHVDAENATRIEAEVMRQRPPEVPGSLADAAEARQALQRQTEMLVREARARAVTDGGADEDGQGAVVLSEEDARAMEREGRMIF